MSEPLQRVRRMTMALPEVSEKLSHGEPIWFVRKRVFAMFSNNHHNDGHIAVWIPAAPGVQGMLIQNWPRKYYRPPYVGPSGWVGIELKEVSDEELEGHLQDAWKLIVEKSRAKKSPPAKAKRSMKTSAADRKRR